MNNEIELAPHIEELNRALEENIESDKIENELKNCLEKFGLPIGEAKRCVVKKFGYDPKVLGNAIDKTIRELNKTDNSVNLLCRIIYVDEKEITVDNKPKKIFFGIFGDTTGTIPFTAWEEFGYDKGDVVRIYNAYIRENNGKSQVNLGKRTHIRIMPPDALPNTIGKGQTTTECTVNEFKDGLGNINAVVRILEVEERSVEIEGKQKQLFKGYFADETGKCRFASWSDFSLNVGDVVQVSNGYVRSWRGVPEMQLNGGTVVEKLTDDKLPDLETLQKDKVFTISKFKTLGGSVGVVLEGIVLDVRPGSGLVERCSDCNRVLQKGLCMVHGKVTGEYDLRVKGILDDGTGAMTVILGKDITEHLLGLDLQSSIDLAKENMRTEVIYDKLIEKLLARPLRVSGTVVVDDFGFMMIGNKAELIVPKVKTESMSLLDDLGININSEV
jgi:replication factor A1